MLDRTIPYYNIIMRCDDYEKFDVDLPNQINIVTYKKGYKKYWEELEYAIGDFDSLQEAENYFIKNYLQDESLFENILFTITNEGEIVGSCIAWTDKKGCDTVNSLHWLVVKESHQNLGIGRALTQAGMNIFYDRGGNPIYIHTQPWSWKAINLYRNLGFKIQKDDTFGSYKNEYEQAVEVLRKYIDI